MSKRAMVTLMLGSWLVLAARPTSADEKRDDAERELKKLEGTWVMVSGERDGKVLAADVVKKARLVIQGIRAPRSQCLHLELVRNAEQALADAVDQPLGDQAAVAVEDVVDLVIVRIRIAAHPEEFGARFPDGDRDIVQAERLRDRASDPE